MPIVNLPNGIDYSKYTNMTMGSASSIWGPALWTSLFTCIMGRYPIKIDNKNEIHIKIKKSFKSILINLSTIMPCIFCRDSFKVFVKQLPIDSFLVGRIELMYWFYQIKDKVNKKLICQEKICYNDEKKRLKKLYYQNKLTSDEYYSKVKLFKKNVFLTISSPPFEEILDKYESYRAVCNKKAKVCSLPKKTL